LTPRGNEDCAEAWACRDFNCFSARARTSEKVPAGTFGTFIAGVKQAEQRNDPLITSLGSGGVTLFDAIELVLKCLVKGLPRRPCADDFVFQFALRIAPKVCRLLAVRIGRIQLVQQFAGQNRAFDADGGKGHFKFP
jgi:hypothetical protein